VDPVPEKEPFSKKGSGSRIEGASAFWLYNTENLQLENSLRIMPKF
jgi:hypothetical protein